MIEVGILIGSMCGILVASIVSIAIAINTNRILINCKEIKQLALENDYKIRLAKVNAIRDTAIKLVEVGLLTHNELDELVKKLDNL